MSKNEEVQRRFLAQTAYLVFVNKLSEISVEPPVEFDFYIDALRRLKLSNFIIV